MKRILLAVLAIVLGCVAPRAPAVVVAVEVRPTERRAPGMMDAATEIIDANVGAIVHLDRVRAHHAAWNIVRLGGYDKFCDDAGLDPVFDVDAFFVGAVDLASCTETLVLRHHLAPDRVAAVFASLEHKSADPPAVLRGLGVPAIAVRTREKPQVVFAPRPDHLVMIPREQLERAAAFLGASPLPGPRNDEAWSGWGTDGGWPLLGRFVPALVVPSAFVATSLGDRHVMRARLHALSPDSARNNAAILQRLTDRVLRIPLVGAMLLDPIDFHVDGSDVITQMSLTPPEHEWLLAQMDDGCW